MSEFGYVQISAPKFGTPPVFLLLTLSKKMPAGQSDC